MGWRNPPVPWSEMEGLLSDRRRPGNRPAGADGGDSPAWSTKRAPYVPPVIERPAGAVPYAELHAHSSFSFLDGASSPEELAEEAERQGLHALAITDHDGFYGIVRFAEAAEGLRLKTVFGAELSLELPATQNGEPDPVGAHLLVLARGEEGYHRLAGALTHAQLAGREKGRPVYDLDDLAARSRDASGVGHWVIMTGCRKGTVRRALAASGAAGAAAELDRLVERFGADAVCVELIDHGSPLDSRHNDVLFALAQERGLDVVATNNVHYAVPERSHLAAAVAAVRAHRGLDEIDGWLPAHDGAHVRSGAEMAERFARYPGVIERTVTLADELAASPGVGGGAAEVSRPHRRRRRAHRQGARGDRGEGFPRLLPHRARHRAGGASAGHPVSGARVGREQRGLLSARHHRGGFDRLQAAVRAVPVVAAR